jgi:MerR family transcriptional regulator, light-induced transcriptional regulator
MGSTKYMSLVRDTGSGNNKNSESGQSRGGSAKGPETGEPSERSGDFVSSVSTVTLLAQAIQREIIPRLMLAHRTPPECSAPHLRVAAGIGPADVKDFVGVLLKGTEADAINWIENVCRLGCSVETMYLDLLAPAARQVGEMWDEDLCDFTEVTIALGQLHKMLRLVQDGYDRHHYPAPNGFSVLLMPSPGEQHTLGLTMVADFFQQAGWEVAGGPYAASDDPVTMVRHKKYDAIGFSLATSKGFNRLKDCIAAVRTAASPSLVCIIVGGPFFTAHPEQATNVGADLVVHDAALAPELAQFHIESVRGNLKARVFKH